MDCCVTIFLKSSSHLQAMPSGPKRCSSMNFMMPLAAMSMVTMSPNFPMMIMPVKKKNNKTKKRDKRSNEIVKDQLPSHVPGCLPDDVPFGILTQVDGEIQEVEEKFRWASHRSLSDFEAAHSFTRQGLIIGLFYL